MRNRTEAGDSLAISCPLSTQVKGYPFEVRLEIAGQKCVVLSDQVQSLDWKTRETRKTRKARKKGTAPDPVMAEVRAKTRALLAIR